MHGIYRPAPHFRSRGQWMKLARQRNSTTTLFSCILAIGSRAAVSPTWDTQTDRAPGNCPTSIGDGSVDLARLPKAIDAVLRSYRGVKVSIPEDAAPEVLVRLALAANRVGHMPHQAVDPADSYVALAEAPRQLGWLDDVVSAT